MPEQGPELVVVGRVGGAYGVGGMVRITSSTVPPENILRYRPWLIGRGDRFVEVEVECVRPHGPGFIARFAGVADREQAQALAGRLLAVPRDALPPLETEREYYWRDLLGLEVVDTAGRSLGHVDHLLETGANDVLVITGGEREVLVPFMEQFVLEVDLAGRRIRVDWPEPG